MPGDKLFVDKSFPPEPSSLGELEILDTGVFNVHNIEWCRVKEVLGCDWDTQPLLIEDGITPDDINQGGLGNCWLLGGLACIAQRFPELIESRFTAPRHPETGKPTISASGRYIIQLWDLCSECWCDIIIDDMIPCRAGCSNPTPIFAKAAGNEAWVLLMEKAFAKYFGSYAALEGGYAELVFKIIGGDRVEDFITYIEPTGVEPWLPARAGLEVTGSIGDRAVLGNTMYRAPDAKAITTVKLFEKLRNWINSPTHDFIIGAGSKGDSDHYDINGIVCGHAYAVLDIVVLPGFSMLKLANPHGTSCKEWTGAWCNTDSKSWKQHPEDMDFDRYFRTLYVARVPKGNNPVLSGKEGAAKYGPLESGEWVEESSADTSDVDDGSGAEEQEREEQQDGDDYDDGGDRNDDDSDAEEPFDFAQHCRDVFDAYSEGRGTLYRSELMGALTSISSLTVPRPLVNQLLNAVGLSWDDQVSFNKLMSMVQLLNPVRLFMQYDKDGNGALTHAELQLIAKRIIDSRVAHRSKRSRAVAKVLGYATGHRYKDVQEMVDGLIENYDENDDGQINFPEFVRMLDDVKLC